jgi:hypothetical protein
MNSLHMSHVWCADTCFARTLNIHIRAASIHCARIINIELVASIHTVLSVLKCCEIHTYCARVVWCDSHHVCCVGICCTRAKKSSHTSITHVAMMHAVTVHFYCIRAPCDVSNFTLLIETSKGGRDAPNPASWEHTFG